MIDRSAAIEAAIAELAAPGPSRNPDGKFAPKVKANLSPPATTTAEIVGAAGNDAGNEPGETETGGDVETGTGEAETETGGDVETETETEENGVKASGEESERDEDAEITPKTVSKQFKNLRRYEKTLKSYETRLRSTVSDLEARSAEIERKASAIQELETGNEWDVIQRVAELKGIDLTDFVRRAIVRLGNGDLTPEDKVKDTEKALLDKINSLEKKIEGKDQETNQAKQVKIIRDFIDDCNKSFDPETYPILSEMDGQEVTAKALAVADKYAKKTGRIPSGSDVLDYLEEDESEKAFQRAAKAKARKSGSNGTEDAGNTGQPGKKTERRPITNGVTGQRSNGQGQPLPIWDERLAAAIADLK